MVSFFVLVLNFIVVELWLLFIFIVELPVPTY